MPGEWVRRRKDPRSRTNRNRASYAGCHPFGETPGPLPACRDVSQGGSPRRACQRGSEPVAGCRWADSGTPSSRHKGALRFQSRRKRSSRRPLAGEAEETTGKNRPKTGRSGMAPCMSAIILPKSYRKPAAVKPHPVAGGPRWCRSCAWLTLPYVPSRPGRITAAFRRSATNCIAACANSSRPSARSRNSAHNHSLGRDPFGCPHTATPYISLPAARPPRNATQTAWNSSRAALRIASALRILIKRRNPRNSAGDPIRRAKFR
jgi:hypothetical protein